MTPKKRITFVSSFLTVLLLCSMAFAQNTFARRIKNSGLPSAMTSSADGGALLVSGYPRDGSTVSRILLRKVNASGEKIWQKELESSSLALNASGVAQVSNGDYILTGFKGNPGYSGFLGHLGAIVARVTSTGQISSQKSFDETSFSSKFYSVVAFADGGIVAAGLHQPDVPGDFESDNTGVIIAHLDSSNKIRWAKVFSSDSVTFSYPITLLKTSDQALILASRAEASSGQEGTLVLKLDLAGNVLWKKFLKRNDLSFQSAAATATGGSILAFSFKADIFGDIFLVRLSSSGGIIWRKRFRVASTTSYSFSLTQSSDGGFAITGFLVSPLTGFIAKFNAAGRVVFAARFDTNLKYEPASILQTSDSGHILFGSVFGQTEDLDLFVLKLDSNANVPGCGLFRSVAIQTAVFGSLNVSNLPISTQDWVPSEKTSDIRSRSVQRTDSSLCQ